MARIRDSGIAPKAHEHNIAIVVEVGHRTC